MKTAVVLLAAGASSSVGRPKLLLPWQGTKVVAHLLEQWTLLDPARVAVVCSADHIALHRELDRVSFSAEPRAGDKALPSAHEHVWGFKAADGKLFTLRRGRFSEAIWLDKRIRARELHPRLRLTPGARDSEVLTLRSIRNGVVQDLYYYCDVRSIKSVSPEPCYCCQGSVELVEKPFRGKPEE